MPAADMFIHSILELWGMSEELPFIYAPWGQQWFDWCFAQALKRRKDFIAVLETVVSAEQAEATPVQSPESAPRYRNIQLRVKRIHGFMSVRPDYFRTAQCNAK